MNAKPWQRRASPLARQALFCYGLLIVYGSLYPFSGWLALGVGPFDYLFAPFPRYLTTFDVLTNVLGYMPLGALAVLACYPRVRGSAAVLLAACLGIVLSGSMEAIQTYLPERVASSLDLASNALGALLGAALMAPCTGALLDRGFVRRLRFIWFERRASFLLTLVLLWPFAQMFPQPFLFGGGDWPRELWAGLDPGTRGALLAWAPQLIWLPDLLGGLVRSSVWESWVTALNLLALTLMATLAMRPAAPRGRLLLAVIVGALMVKAAADALQSTGQIFDWLTSGAVLGLLVGSVVALAAARLPYTARAALAFCALVAALLLVNLLPLNPYFPDVLAGWRQGQYRHLNVLAQWLAWAWPYAALAWLSLSVEQAWLARRARRGKPSSASL